MTDDVQRQITWLLCFDDGEADHIGAARCAETMKSQQARIKSLEKVLVAARYAVMHVHAPVGVLEQSYMNDVKQAIADCDNKPAPTKKPGKAHPWRKTQAPQR